MYIHKFIYTFINTHMLTYIHTYIHNSYFYKYIIRCSTALGTKDFCLSLNLRMNIYLAVAQNTDSKHVNSKVHSLFHIGMIQSAICKLTDSVSIGHYKRQQNGHNYQTVRLQRTEYICLKLNADHNSNSFFLK